MIISFSEIKYFNGSFKKVRYFYRSCCDSGIFGESRDRRMCGFVFKLFSHGSSVKYVTWDSEKDIKDLSFKMVFMRPGLCIRYS